MASKFVQKVEQLVAANPLVMFSKTTCGYCGRGECRRAHGARGREGGGRSPARFARQPNVPPPGPRAPTGEQTG